MLSPSPPPYSVRVCRVCKSACLTTAVADIPRRLERTRLHPDPSRLVDSTTTQHGGLAARLCCSDREVGTAGRSATKIPFAAVARGTKRCFQSNRSRGAGSSQVSLGPGAEFAGALRDDQFSIRVL